MVNISWNRGFIATFAAKHKIGPAFRRRHRGTRVILIILLIGRPALADFPRKTLAEWGSLAAKELKGADPATLTWQTPEGIAVKPLYTAADLEGLGDRGAARLAALLRGPRATMYANRPWTIRQYAGFSTAEESNAFYRDNLAAGAEGPLGRLRSRHPSRLRFRSSARRRRCRQGRRRDRFRRGHEDPVRRHPARPDERVDDHERRGAAGARQLHRRGARSRA